MKMLKSISLFVILISINNIVRATPVASTDIDNAFTIPLPRICIDSKREIYSNLIKNSNQNFIRAYQTYMPRECNYSHEVVRIVEAYRNAANYVVIFLNKRGATDEQFNEVVELYDLALIQFNEAIRTLTVGRRLTRVCYNSLMLIKGAVTTTGEGLVTGTIATYNTKCASDRIHNTLIHKPIQFISNYLN
ncbi:uncharacterized protein LOC119081372 isoform X2 [Bradysia coprophila]|uniref:uncharacterized protein LOC119081372 isoform X2 n=1 Tax=Bradysia coprophila TaxID=38358 RepID=UPI00187D8230|nr:uncharacterized protein LOC119081372 isoform X2 [Bradysia coprophila]